MASDVQSASRCSELCLAESKSTALIRLLHFSLELASSGLEPWFPTWYQFPRCYRSTASQAFLTAGDLSGQIGGPSTQQYYIGFVQHRNLSSLTISTIAAFYWTRSFLNNQIESDRSVFITMVWKARICFLVIGPTVCSVDGYRTNKSIRNVYLEQSNQA